MAVSGDQIIQCNCPKLAGFLHLTPGDTSALTVDWSYFSGFQKLADEPFFGAPIRSPKDFCQGE